MRIAVFDLDATPPVGSRLTYDPAIDRGELGLRCRGLVLSGLEKPVVLCAVDWIGIANEGHDAFRNVLAEAAGTTADRVAVHVLHPHDAPICDFTSERLLKESGQDPLVFESSWQRQFLQQLGTTVRGVLAKAQPVTHVGFGEGVVEGVASNRRILGPDGKVKAVRYTACKDPAVRNEPEGTIDPIATAVSFWNGDEPLAVLTYYATHPQSYYRTGIANPDFPGIARFLREQEVPVPHIHFNGAGGNIGAGKYNDGSPANRPVLAKKLAAGLAKAWEATKKQPISAKEISWKVAPVALPPADFLDAAKLTESLRADRSGAILGSAMQLAWLQRCQGGHKIELSRLRLGSVDLLHLPGELFVEYQLEAKKAGGSRRVACAAYGDYGPGYIGTEISYSQGGYETQPSSSFTAPGVEKVLLEGIRELVKP
ncbi:MAG: hypothetical protein KA004_12530 [Verrucomicrobiales bacterium]|nr:hypothetical protein [Verrucomicrobiales bacterium]